MAEILQKGTDVPADETNRRWSGKVPRATLGFGTARKAADAVAPNRREKQLDDMERQAVGYAKGGSVKPKKLTMKDFEDSPADNAMDKKGLAEANRKRGFADGGFVNHTQKTDAAGGPAKVKRGYGKARGA